MSGVGTLCARVRSGSLSFSLLHLHVVGNVVQDTRGDDTLDGGKRQDAGSSERSSLLANIGQTRRINEDKYHSEASSFIKTAVSLHIDDVQRRVFQKESRRAGARFDALSRVSPRTKRARASRLPKAHRPSKSRHNGAGGAVCFSRRF